MTLPLSQLWAELGIPADYAATRRMPVHREARKLKSIGRNPDGRVVTLSPRAAAAWRKLKAAAAKDGVELVPISGFRSVKRQATIIRAKLVAGNRISRILRLVAAPGCSEHHSGRALDIGSPDDCRLDEQFARTAAFRWLKRHATHFGFILSYPRRNVHRIGYEPWHWYWCEKCRRDSICKSQTRRAS